MESKDQPWYPPCSYVMAWHVYDASPCAGMKSGSLYKHLIGKIVLVPGSEFGVDVPEFYYKGIAPQASLPP